MLVAPSLAQIGAWSKGLFFGRQVRRVRLRADAPPCRLFDLSGQDSALAIAEARCAHSFGLVGKQSSS